MRYGRIVYQDTITQVLDAGSGNVQLPDGTLLQEQNVQWLAPLSPGTIFAIGLNYMNHAKELSFAKTEEPMVFFKGPNTVTGHRCTTRRPADVNFMHYECELAVIIGKDGKDIDPAMAMKHVAGYTVGNDYAFRNYLKNYYRPNLRVKSRDCALPLGPWFVDATDIDDPMNLNIRTFVNGKQTQDGNTKDMLFDITFLISYFSQILTLRSGDIILTGTPEGIANVVAGDEVITEIESVGRLINTIVGDDEYPLTPCAYR